jgi:lysine 2,3-aminomutase
MQQLNTSQNKSDPTYQNQYREALKSFKEIKSFFDLDYEFESHFDCFIPLHFAKKIKAAGPGSSLWKQFIPAPEELSDDGLLDPIGDIKNAKNGGIIHRYKNRILFTPTINCPVICRYCFRKNELSEANEIFKNQISELGSYLSSHPEVNEVILTGGDPLVLSDKKLKKIFDILKEQNIKFVRLHTRTPVILPSRIDEGFTSLMQEYSREFTKIIFVLHVNHSDEIDQEVFIALEKLRDLPIKRLTQSVLLKGVNNSVDTLINLIYKILDCDFTPYYLHHPDQVRGAMHFRLSLEEGREIYQYLRDQVPGWAIPHYIIDNSKGLGKQLAFNPERISFHGKMLDKNGVLQDY